jgi:class 3 adenylate cyclase
LAGNELNSEGSFIAADVRAKDQNIANSRTFALEEANEVTYTVLDAAGVEKNRLLQSVATAINVRLALDEQELPYEEFDNFSVVSRQDKIFLFGPGGSGKSRSILEIIRRNIDDYSRIVVINPRNTIGTESGRVRLSDLVGKISDSDAVVWDNFPDDLVKRDSVNAREVLERLSSRKARKLLVALKPKYLEVLREVPSEIAEFYSHRIAYDREKFKSIVRLYGTKLEKYNQTYESVVAPDLERIARMLWQREPIPLTILDYYNELKAKTEDTGTTAATRIDGFAVAENLLRSTNYYEHQFALLTGFQERRSDVEFLYTLKLAYELGIGRDAAGLEKLQNEIFGSNPPRAPNEKLSTWVYLSGSYYSMHDVCREAIRFTDFVRLRILSYLSQDPSKLVGMHKDAGTIERSLALFLGRHVQHVPRESYSELVPEGVHSYMKRVPAFSRAFGLGVGEVFDSIEEDLQNTVLVKVDVDVPFGSGLAESLGHEFPSLDPERRRIVLQKIYSGLLFARYFGQSLGRLMSRLPEEIRGEIRAHMEWNPQFADGIGMGLGYIYSSLDDDSRKQAFLLAEKNIGMARGLGFGFGLTFQSLGEGDRSQVLARANLSSEFDKGVGMGLGELFHDRLPEEGKANALQRMGVRSEFAMGIGISVARANSEKSHEDLMDRLDSDAELAHGLGMGYGASLVYLSRESLAHLLSLADENERFDLGLGSGVGFIYKHLPAHLQDRFFERGGANNEFDQGLGFGLGFTWVYQNAEMRKRAFDRAASHNSFAYGLGYGVGYHFRYFENPLKQDLLERAVHDSEFAKGLGYGLGYSYPYLDSDTKNLVLDRIDSDQKFANGLGIGLGRVLRYLTQDEKESVLARAESNNEFGRGLGYGLGRYVIMYTDKEFQRDLFARMKDNSSLAFGVGHGLSYSYTHISVEFQNRIMGQMALQSNEFARGLGAGFGANIRYLPANLRDRLFSYAEQNIQFAQGFGESVGGVFGYLNKIIRDRIFVAATSESAFARGLGQGLGTIYRYLEEGLKGEVLSRAESNGQLTYGLGVGLGSVYVYLPDSLRGDARTLAGRSPEFLMGFGEGIGSVLKYRPSTLGEKGIATFTGRWEFAMGLGRGQGSSYTNHDKKISTIPVSESSDKAVANSYYSGLGLGLGSNLAGISNELLAEIFKLCERNQSFATSVGFGVARAFQYLSAAAQNDILHGQVNSNSDFAQGFGLGMGHDFVFLPPEIQERVLALSKEHRDLSEGLGYSLGRIFRYLDSAMQTELTSNESNSDFARAFGTGLAQAFPLLTLSFQQQMILKLEKAGPDNSLATGLGVGLSDSMRYLERSVQDALLAIAEKNPYAKGLLFGKKDGQSRQFDYFVDLPIVPITFSTSGHFEAAAWNLSVGPEEIVFSGQRSSSCVCIVDMVNSTGLTAGLNDVQLGRFYSIFLNAMATIARNFGAKIIKNAGDSLLFYFPRTVDSTNPTNFRDVLECGMTMLAARQAINAKLLDEKMPSVSYRISADHGRVEIAKSVSSQSDDLFGPAMNMTAKINSKARPNGMAIGENLHRIVKVLDEYTFSIEQESLLENQNNYALYHVDSRDPRNIINPFKRTSSSSR